MNDTLYGGEAWSRPCECYCGPLAGRGVINAGLLGLSRSLVCENEAHFQRLSLSSTRHVSAVGVGVHNTDF